MNIEEATYSMGYVDGIKEAIRILQENIYEPEIECNHPEDLIAKMWNGAQICYNCKTTLKESF